MNQLLVTRQATLELEDQAVTRVRLVTSLHEVTTAVHLNPDSSVREVSQYQPGGSDPPLAVEKGFF
jgi:hypothetical protein